ncbi:MAG: type II toxin-antitoxin system RelE/ParE family toxin [Coriobacteriales bacterium]|jgi:plasmid stabilization system protein ParE|nr:type II toxin-antitoxin system RelE/ParE family toxin [Coriobacteriales bacterium]
MNPEVDFLAAARKEYFEAVCYYSDRSEGVGLRFIEAIEATLARIADDPKRYPVRDGLRRCVLTKFPYNIHYRILDTGPQVVAVAHQKREPGYWLSRIEGN